MLNEWSSTTLNPSFWIVSCATPTILFTLYFLFQWILGEDPREAIFNEDTVKNWEFFLGDQREDQSFGPPRVLKYAVLDRSRSFSTDVRNEILDNDCYSFLTTILHLNGDDFETFREVYSDTHSELLHDLTLLRQRFVSTPTRTLVAELLGNIPRSEDLSDVVEIATLLENLKQWLNEHQEATIKSIPTLSSNYFRDLTPLDMSVSSESLESLLSRNEIVGYFVFPENIETDLEELEFVTRKETPRSEFLDLLNWYRSVTTDVLRKRRYEAENIDSLVQSLLTQRVNVVPTDIDIVPSKSSVTTLRFEGILYIALAFLMYVVFLVSSARLVSNVIDEKSNKLADNLLANLSPSHLLDGKLWGTAMISLTVVGLWLVLVPILAFVTGRWNFNVEIDVFAVFLQPFVIFNFVLFLLLAYAFYGYLFVGFTSLFSKVSIAVNSWAGIVVGIGFIFVTPSLLLISFLPFTWLQNLLSFIPVFTPFVMIARSGTLPDWGMYCTIVCFMVACVLASRAVSSLMFKRGISDEVRVKPLKRGASKSESVPSSP